MSMVRVIQPDKRLRQGAACRWLGQFNPIKVEAGGGMPLVRIIQPDKG